MPFVESFLATIKNNNSIKLDKSRHFRKTMGGFKWSGKNQFNFPKATPQEIIEIREKLKKENKKRNIKLVIILSAIAIICISIIISL